MAHKDPDRPTSASGAPSRAPLPVRYNDEEHRGRGPDWALWGFMGGGVLAGVRQESNYLVLSALSLAAWIAMPVRALVCSSCGSGRCRLRTLRTTGVCRDCGAASRKGPWHGVLLDWVRSLRRPALGTPSAAWSLHALDRVVVAPVRSVPTNLHGPARDPKPSSVPSEKFEGRPASREGWGRAESRQPLVAPKVPTSHRLTFVGAVLGIPLAIVVAPVFGRLLHGSNATADRAVPGAVLSQAEIQRAIDEARRSSPVRSTEDARAVIQGALRENPEQTRAAIDAMAKAIASTPATEEDAAFVWRMLPPDVKAAIGRLDEATQAGLRTRLAKLRPVLEDPVMREGVINGLRENLRQHATRASSTVR